MTTRNKTTKHVRLDDRHFIVAFDSDGEPCSIKERKVYAPGTPHSALYNAPYWHKSAKLGGPETRPRRIIEAAKGVTTC